MQSCHLSSLIHCTVPAVTGRQGSPKSRVLRFSTNDGDAYISWGDAATKRLYLRDVLSVRKGNDPDPIQTSPLGVEEEVEEEGLSGGLVLGTKILRRTAKLHELSLCMSLILQDRCVIDDMMGCCWHPVSSIMRLID